MAWSVALTLALQTVTFGGSGSTTLSGSGQTDMANRWLMLVGDSKTQGATATWPTPISLRGSTETGHVWYLSNVGVGGATVATVADGITATLASMPAASVAADIRVLINLGVNDITTTLPSESTWNANYLTIIDAIHVKWPTAKVYLMRPWLHGNPSPSYDTECNTVADRIASIISERSSFVFAGPDERVWLKGSDDGASMTTDLTHYNAAGNTEVVNQWAAVLWP